jgi:hypothetical protein|tara:strand:+ start:844 stop:1239 length:396 start_codon:yes stop_codon:yes gene_type:complete
MAIRDDLITQITTNLSGYTNFRVSSELPFESGGNSLFLKNKRTIYVDDLSEEQIQLYRTVDQGTVYQTETIVQAFLTVDAKNQPSDIEDVIQAILNAKSVVTETQSNEAIVASDIEDDYITYTFEYTILKT